MVCETMGWGRTGLLSGTDHDPPQIRQSPPSNRLWTQQSFFDPGSCHAHVRAESGALGHRESPALAPGCHPWRRWLSNSYWSGALHSCSHQQRHFKLDGSFGHSQCPSPGSLFRCSPRSGCSGSSHWSLLGFLEWESPALHAGNKRGKLRFCRRRKKETSHLLELASLALRVENRELASGFVPSSKRSSLGHGKREPEGRSLAGDALQAKIAMMRLDNCPANIQPQAKTWAGVALSRDALDPIKALPDTFLLLRRETRPLIVDRDSHGVLYSLNADGDRLIRRGIFRRVGQVVMHHLAKPISVTKHHHLLAGAFFKRDRPPRHVILLIFHGLDHNFAQITEAHHQLKFISLDARDIEQIANHAILHVDPVLGLAQVILHLGESSAQRFEFGQSRQSQFREPALGQLNISLDTCQGCAQFMAGNAKKFIKTPVRFAQGQFAGMRLDPFQLDALTFN